MSNDILSPKDFARQECTGIEASSVPKNLDIFQHWKLSMKNEMENCACKGTVQYYCIPCKVSVCEQCNWSSHLKHLWIRKDQFEITPDSLNKLFSNIEKFDQTCGIISNSTAVKFKFDQQIDDFVKGIEEQLHKYKEEKKEEIRTMFSSWDNSTVHWKKRISETKNGMKAYLERNKKFFNLDQDKNENPDRGNTHFLLNYDMVFWWHAKNLEIESISESLNQSIKLYEETQKTNLETIQQEIKRLLSIADPNGKDTTKTGGLVQRQPSITVNVNSKFSTSSSNQKWNGNNNNSNHVNNNNNASSEIKTLLNDDVKTGEEETLSTYKQFISYTDELNKNIFEDLNLRLEKYNNQIESFRHGVFLNYQKCGNFKEIDRLCHAYETSKQKGLDSLFSGRLNQEKSKASLKTTTQAAVAAEKLNLTSKEEIVLNNPLLEKYYSYLVLDLYETHFRMVTKELQSSHADLMIRVNEDEEEGDSAKIIEGTNEVNIYEKKTGKIIKYILKWTKNPFGYTKFPFGTRSLLLGDKLYITGGKDEMREYGNVIIFDRKEQKIKRIMDMRHPRSYHTMIFSDVFDTIMVFGGENINTVEIFDPCVNRWQLLPDLNVPRAGLLFHFDRPRGIWYAMFGKEGWFKNDNYSDIIEYLDLSKLNYGWMNLNYKNKAEIDWRSFMSIYPLNEDMLLLYGGVTFRKTSKSLCIWNIAKNEVIKVDQRWLEQWRIQAKKSRRWSSIVGISPSTNTWNSHK